LRRRFNTVVMPLPKTLEEEVKIVTSRISASNKEAAKVIDKGLEEIKRLVTIFRELRAGTTEDGRSKVNKPSSTLSTAEAISVVNNGIALATHFGDGKITVKDLAAGMTGTIVKDPVQDKIVWQEYLETVAKERKEWKDLYTACKKLI